MNGVCPGGGLDVWRWREASSLVRPLPPGGTSGHSLAVPPVCGWQSANISHARVRLRHIRTSDFTSGLVQSEYEVVGESA